LYPTITAVFTHIGLQLTLGRSTPTPYHKIYNYKV